MTHNNIKIRLQGGHRIIMMLVLCLFGLCLIASSLRLPAPKKPAKDDRVYLVHADELKYDAYGLNPRAQIAKGKVHFRHNGANLWCDSAYFFQEDNAMKAFGHVRFKQGDTLSLTCDYAEYDGVEQMMLARRNVVMKHRGRTLYTDSLNYDRLYSYAYFFEGGELIDGKDKLVADWGEYNTATREAAFFYNVKMLSDKQVILTDSLFYDTGKSMAHVTGPSRITSNGSIIKTENAYLNTKTDQSQLYGRSTIIDKEKTIVGDSLFHNNDTGINEGFGNVIYIDTLNKNELRCNRLFYNEKTDYGYATDSVLLKDFSRQSDTLYMHSDSLKLYTYNIDTDSVYRKVHGFSKVKVYRTDVQAVCDSLVFNSLDSCLTMYRDPIVWNDNRQLLGEKIEVYMNDSTVRLARVIGQALSVELIDKEEHYNQVSSRLMDAYFTDGALRRLVSTGNVKSVYYISDDKDSTLTNLNYIETDTMRLFMSPTRQLEKIWAPKAVGTIYPMTQIPPERYKLPEFAWFDKLRPTSPADVFNWRGKSEDQKLKIVERQAAPIQRLRSRGGGLQR